MLKQQHKTRGPLDRPAQFLVFIGLFAILAVSCGETVFTPKPRGYSRIDLPERTYKDFKAEYCPLTFTYPGYGVVERKTTYFNETPDHSCWMNIDMPYFNSKIHMSYVDVDSDEMLEQVINDSYKYAFKHTIKADFIDETRIIEDGLYAVVFDIGGNVASSVQFFATDSAEHYLRGSLYFNEQPNVDSLKPVIEYIRQDMLAMVRSIKWKE